MNIASRYTPIDDKYETCEYTEALLVIYPETIEPDRITKELGVVPTRVGQRGERRVSALGKEWFVRDNFWVLSSKGKVLSKDLRRHIDWILDMIKPFEEQLLKIQQYPGLRMAMRCNWWSAYGEGGPTLWPEQMKRMAQLNLEWTIDVQFSGDDEGSKPTS